MPDYRIKGAPKELKIDELIRQIHQSDMVKRRIEDLAVRNRGISITAEEMKELEKKPGDDVRIFAGGKTIADVSSDHVDERYIYTAPSIIAKTRGNIDFELYDGPFTHKSEIWSYTVNDDNVDHRYVYYYLKHIKEELADYAKTKSVKITQLSTGDLDRLLIPLPPLKVQQEIADYLDDLKTSTDEIAANLEREAEIREKLYKGAQRRILLNATNHPDVQRRTIKDFARRNKGISITTEKMRELEKLPGDDVRIFAGGQTIADVSFDHVDKKHIYTEPSIIAKTRGIISFERYGDPFTHKSEIWSYTVQDGSVDQDFIYFYLDFLRDDLTEYALTKSVRITQLSTKDLDNLIVPLPPLEVQREASSILNELESSSHFLVSQAHQAAENYRKSYAYALDQLFDFVRFD